MNLKNIVYRLERVLVACPFKDPKADCPFAVIRRLPLEEREKASLNYSAVWKTEALDHHQGCLYNRLFFRRISRTIKKLFSSKSNE